MNRTYMYNYTSVNYYIEIDDRKYLDMDMPYNGYTYISWDGKLEDPWIFLPITGWKIKWKNDEQAIKLIPYQVRQHCDSLVARIFSPFA
jgi:hypothetical protein